MSTDPTPIPTLPWLTPEHLQATIKQLLTLAVTIGVLQTSDATNLQTQLVACVSAAFIFIANAWQVVTFIQGQVKVRTTKP
jgi:hypothetical protein